MKESEVRVLWARLDDFTGPSASRARSNLDAARAASEAGDGSARFWLGRYHALRNETDEAESAFQEALRIEPQVPEYLLGLIDLYWGHRSGAAWMDAARSPQVGKLIGELEPIARTARQHNAVAVHRLIGGDVPGALEHSKRACERGPDCWQCFHNRASALFAAGQRDEAAAAERTALDRLPERSAGNAATEMRKALDLYSRPQKPGPNTEIPGLIAP
jgi:tetratricopeptide (TPR) repeat protein